MPELVLEKGRPKNLQGRSQREIRVYDLLDSLGIGYERIDHERADTMEACLAVDEAIHANICKNLFLCNRQQTEFYLLMMPGEKKFKTKELSHQIGSARLSFAGEEFLEKYLDIHPGSVSVMGLMNDHDHHVQLLIDRELLKGEYFGCHPCENTASLRIRTADLMEKFLPAVHHEALLVDLTGED
jgi:Ala-tRNA(Pro) deacylase